MGGAARPSVRDPVDTARDRARVPPAAARHHSRDADEARPRYSKDVAVDVVCVEDIDARASQEPGKADSLTHRARPIQTPQRQVYQLRAGLLVASPQGAVRVKVDNGKLKPLRTEVLGPANRVELGAADLEVVDAEREPNHRSQSLKVGHGDEGGDTGPFGNRTEHE